MATLPTTLQELNTLDQEGFVQALSSLFEGPPWIVREAWHARPFESVEQLHHTLCNVTYNAPVEQEIAIALGEVAKICSFRLHDTVR